MKVMDERIAKTTTITTVDGEEYVFKDEQAQKVLKVFIDAVEEEVPYIFIKDTNKTNIFQLNNLIGVHVTY